MGNKKMQNDGKEGIKGWEMATCFSGQVGLHPAVWEETRSGWVPSHLGPVLWCRHWCSEQWQEQQQHECRYVLSVLTEQSALTLSLVPALCSSTFFIFPTLFGGAGGEDKELESWNCNQACSKCVEAGQRWATVLHCKSIRNLCPLTGSLTC